MGALTPLAIALQGIGYGTFLTAMQGLYAVLVVPEASDAVPGEHQAAIQPRRRVRRWGSLAGIPTPWEILQSQEREEEDLLLELGALV